MKSSRLRLVGAVALVVLLLGIGLARNPQVLLQVVVAKERSGADLVVKTITVAGHDIVYLDGGDPDGEPVLLVHGFAADKDNWTRFARHLAPGGYRIIAPDLPGFGESSRDPEHAYTIANQVAFLDAFTRALELGAVHVAGNSMGGNISGGFAARHPDRVRSLGLIAAGGVTSPQPPERVTIMERTGVNPLLVEDVEDFDRLLDLIFVVPPAMPGVMKQYFADRAVANRGFNDKIFADITAPSGGMSLEPLLPSLTLPTLILWGDTDRVLHPSGADVFAAGLPHAQRVTMTACGHSPMIERPEETAQHYGAFLEDSKGATRAR
jgi:abhydrolase domain-containing protein 6